MSPAPWAETSHLAAAVIVTRVHGCLTAAGHCYVMLGTIKFIDKSVNDNSAPWLDHCDVIASHSGFGVPTGVPYSEVELKTEFKSFTAAHLGSNTNQHTDWTLGSTCIYSSRSVYVPQLVQSVQLLLFKYRGGDKARWISKNKMAATAVQWELNAVRISVKISRICEFRVIMGIMTGLLGCCSSSTLGSRVNDYVKTLATLGFWLHHSPCSLGCWTNNTLAARSLSPKSPQDLPVCGRQNPCRTSKPPLDNQVLTKSSLVQ